MGVWGFGFRVSGIHYQGFAAFLLHWTITGESLRRVSSDLESDAWKDQSLPAGTVPVPTYGKSDLKDLKDQPCYAATELLDIRGMR